MTQRFSQGDTTTETWSSRNGTIDQVKTSVETKLPHIPWFSREVGSVVHEVILLYHFLARHFGRIQCIIAGWLNLCKTRRRG